MTKSIAVLLPVYAKDNIEHFRLSVNSILHQSYPNVTILIGVDGPIPDQLHNVIDEFAQGASVHPFYFDKNRGLAAVLNDLVQWAIDHNYEFLARMDADDIARKDRLQKQINFLQANPNIDVVGGAINLIDEQGHDKGIVTHYPLTPKDCYNYFAKRDPVAHPTVLLRKSFFQKAGLYRPEYRKNQDTMLWFDGLRNGCQMANLVDIVLDFRVNQNFYSQRRNGYAFAKSLYNDRKLINRTLHYGIFARIYALLLFVLRISPVWIKKIAYKKL